VRSYTSSTSTNSSPPRGKDGVDDPPRPNQLSSTLHVEMSRHDPPKSDYKVRLGFYSGDCAGGGLRSMYVSNRTVLSGDIRNIFDSFRFLRC
jgi:hypothetical protein